MGFAGLGKVADKVLGVIKKLQGAVDKALDKLVDKVVKLARDAGLNLGKAETQADKVKRLDKAMAAAVNGVNAIPGKTIQIVAITPVLNVIKAVNRVKRLEAIAENDCWIIIGANSPPQRRKADKKPPRKEQKASSEHADDTTAQTISDKSQKHLLEVVVEETNRGIRNMEASEGTHGIRIRESTSTLRDDTPGRITNIQKCVSLPDGFYGKALVPFPREIAFLMRDYRFPSFAALRRRFWITVATTPPFNKGWTKKQLEAMQEGRAGIVPQSAKRLHAQMRAGTNVKIHSKKGKPLFKKAIAEINREYKGKPMQLRVYQLHHTMDLHIDGAEGLYDVSAIQIVIPSLHRDIHRKAREDSK
jgi:hypothetical protein